MSSISKSIEDYLKLNIKHPSFAQFVDSKQEITKLYIKQFDNETQTEKNLVEKYITQYHAVFPERKRIMGKQVDIGVIYAEARLERCVHIESSRTLEVGVSVAGRSLRRRIEHNEEDTEEVTEGVTEGVTEEVSEKSSNGYSIREGFLYSRENQMR